MDRKTNYHSVEIDFDAEAHTYRDRAGRVVPGVTGIIRACGLVDTRWSNQWHLDRGTAVHRAVELYEKGTLDMGSVDPVIAPYLDAWRAFVAETGYRSTGLERRVYNPAYRYAGTLDQTGILSNKSCVLDLKTGKCQPWWALQTAAYNAVAAQQTRYSVELHDDGSWSLIRHEDRRDFNRFLACLMVFNTREEYGVKE